MEWKLILGVVFALISLLVIILLLTRLMG